MFSYRHAFHAGNHADALKHLTLIATLRHLMAKPAPLLLADTHAGAGLYRLDSEAARTSGEAAQGVLALQAQANGQADGGAPAPEALRDYLDMVASFNVPGKSWRIYPGSPFIMQRLMTAQERAAVHDRLRLFELHPSDIHALQANVAQLQAGRQITIQTEDGFAALPAIIFDEIDTGVSGDISDKMADIMQDLGRKMQVITITHQPQIAARGAAHTATCVIRVRPRTRAHTATGASMAG